jgi:transposase
LTRDINTTSTSFDHDGEEGDSADGGSGLRRYGHSKDHRGDLPQIIIGLAVTRAGIPARVWCWPGNASDQAVLPQVRKRSALDQRQGLDPRNDLMR